MNRDSQLQNLRNLSSATRGSATSHTDKPHRRAPFLPAPLGLFVFRSAEVFATRDQKFARATGHAFYPFYAHLKDSTETENYVGYYRHPRLQ